MKPRLRQLLAELMPWRDGIIQLYGANTDVGKTLVSVGLVREALKRREGAHGVLYLKPMQTGYPTDSDERKVRHYSASNTNTSTPLESDTLFTYSPPLSPHLCGSTPLDDELQLAVLERLHQFFYASRQCTSSTDRSDKLSLLETFGGPGSPTPSRSLQVDALRPLFLPSLLVGDAKLGGISTTLASYEMIKNRGYPVRGVVLLECNQLRNDGVIRQYVDEDVILIRPPDVLGDGPLDDAFLDQIGWKTLFDACFCGDRGPSIQEKKARAKERIWWPFTQHAALQDESHDDISYVSHRTMGDHIATDKGVLLDASASWWTQGISERHVPSLSAVVAGAVGRYGHVLFPRNVHDPALDLAEAMLSHPSHAGYARAFFSDDGSTAVEVALKMAFRKFLVDRGLMQTDTSHGEKISVGVLGVDGSYHGDTLGTMDAVPSSVFTELQTPWTEARGLFLDDVPCVWMKKDGMHVFQGDTSTKLRARTFRELFVSDEAGIARRKAYQSSIEARIDDYEQRTSTMIGACIIEPVVQGAGGMRLIDPEFHRAMDAVCKARRHPVPVIADEVFSGLWRLGVESAAVDLLGIRPSIGCFAKLLTAGIVPLSLTLASEEIFHVFKGDSKALALLHGHSYTAHPVGCAAAKFALEHLRASPVAATELWDADRVGAVRRHPRVDGCWSLGTVFSAKLVSDGGGYESTAAERVTNALVQRGISARPLGDVVYLMVTPFSAAETCDWALDELLAAL